MQLIEQINQILENEEKRQLSSISLIASENITSKAVRNACSSVLTNKYAEGYPNNRYYSGCEYADAIELLCIELVKKIFKCKFANVQPHSGSQANQAAFYALLEPGDTILSLSLKAGGHLTHGAPVSSISKTYKIVNYSLNNGVIDMNEVAAIAKQYKPRLIITGASAYTRNWDWKAFKKIANENNAYLMADIAHIAGLIAGNAHESPVEYADIITSTTHKTLRGTRGGIILWNDENLTDKINKAIFPAVQGGPLMHIIAAKAAGFAENLDPSFAEYAQNVINNAKILEKRIKAANGRLISNGTDNHLMIMDCQSFQMNAKETEQLLKDANVFVSVSALLEDTSWKNPNGIRIGTPYITTLGVTDITEFAELFVKTLTTKNPTDLKKYVIYTANKLYPKFL